MRVGNPIITEKRTQTPELWQKLSADSPKMNSKVTEKLINEYNNLIARAYQVILSSQFPLVCTNTHSAEHKCRNKPMHTDLTAHKLPKINWCD